MDNLRNQIQNSFVACEGCCSAREALLLARLVLEGSMLLMSNEWHLTPGSAFSSTCARTWPCVLIAHSQCMLNNISLVSHMDHSSSPAALTIEIRLALLPSDNGEVSHETSMAQDSRRLDAVLRCFGKAATIHAPHLDLQILSASSNRLHRGLSRLGFAWSC